MPIRFSVNGGADLGDGGLECVYLTSSGQFLHSELYSLDDGRWLIVSLGTGQRRVVRVGFWRVLLSVCEGLRFFDWAGCKDRLVVKRRGGRLSRGFCSTAVALEHVSRMVMKCHRGVGEGLYMSVAAETGENQADEPPTGKTFI